MNVAVSSAWEQQCTIRAILSDTMLNETKIIDNLMKRRAPTAHWVTELPFNGCPIKQKGGKKTD
ncbi:MAG: hypothetical protein LBQ20_00720 [Rhodanobacter sp.]|jgi:hypothetical protein|nr:hypothetical protein [Rhodanobacter sp.]